MPSSYLTEELEMQRTNISDTLETVIMGRDELLDALSDLLPPQLVAKMNEDDSLHDQVFNDLHDAVTSGIKSMATSILTVINKTQSDIHKMNVIKTHDERR